MTAFIQLRLRTKNQTWRGFFSSSSSSSSVLQTAGFLGFFSQNTTEDPMVLKANTSVSVCDTGLHFTEDTNRVFSPPNQAPRRQPSPNQLTSELSATTWGGGKSHGQLSERQCTSCSFTDRCLHVRWHLSIVIHEGAALHHKPIEWRARKYFFDNTK